MTWYRLERLATPWIRLFFISEWRRGYLDGANGFDDEEESWICDLGEPWIIDDYQIQFLPPQNRPFLCHFPNFIEKERCACIIRCKHRRDLPSSKPSWRSQGFAKQTTSLHFSKRLFATSLRGTATSRLRRESWAIAANQIAVSCLSTSLESLSFWIVSNAWFFPCHCPSLHSPL